jgi:hypothetical protein
MISFSVGVLMFTMINENDITFVDEYNDPCMGCNKDFL